MFDHEQTLARAIDDVAARMTAGDAPADLGRRVLERIGERRSPSWMWVLKPAAALAMLAVAIVAVQSLRTSRAAGTQQPPVTHVATDTITGAGDAPAPLDRTAARPARIGKKRTTPRISAAEAAWHERAIPALAAIEALSIDGIQPEALSISQLEVKPLATAPLNVVTIDGKGVR